MSNSEDRIEITSGSTAFLGEKAVNVYRLMTLARGLRSELRGMKLTAGRTCYSIIKEKFGLKGNKQKVLDQFLPILEQAKANIPIVDKQNENTHVPDIDQGN